MTEVNCAANLKTIQSHINDYCRDAGRSPDSVQLLAVSKTHPAMSVRALHLQTGHRQFGENYADELFMKASELSDLPLEWHYIGHLQTNKIQRLVQVAQCIHTVESEKHLRYIARYAEQFGKAPFPIYIAANASGESKKSGVPLASTLELANIASQTYPAIEVCGIMTVPPIRFQDHSYETVPALYREIAAVSRQVGKGRLSLGMTGDLRIAILAGSTCVRIGTAIFGERDYGSQPSSKC